MGLRRQPSHVTVVNTTVEPATTKCMYEYVCCHDVSYKRKKMMVVAVSGGEGDVMIQI